MGRGRSRNQVAKNEEVSLDMNKLVESMRREQEMLVPLSDQCCIYRVRPQLRELNEKAYTPQAVSIGPLHHGKKQLKEMEEYKIRYLGDFLERSNLSLKEYFIHIQELEIRLRNSYGGSIGHTKEKFVKMMAVDGAFVIEFLLKSGSEENLPSNDRIFNKQRLINNIKYDILLLENQLPFFFLDYLFKLCNVLKCGKEVSLTEVVYQFVKSSFGWENLDLNDISKTNEKMEHFVDFLRIPLMPLESHKKGDYESLTTPGISALHRVGVKFKSKSSRSLLDIEFNKGVLEIPKFVVTDHTELFLRNMQAFEQCHNDVNYVNDYIFFMDMLINNPEDVELLVKYGIVENWLEDNAAAAAVFNNLSKENLIFNDYFYFSDTVKNLNVYGKNSCHKWKATFKQKYFQNPWTIISVIAAAFLLILTVVQTICSFLQVI